MILIFDFFLNDSLSFFCRHRCLVRWAEGEKLYSRLWNENEINRIGVQMNCFNDTKPKEIHRKIRDLSHLHHWKGTEFRAFLLYYGIVILKGNIPSDEYDNFLWLFCAVTICCADKYRQNLPKARELFVEYIEMYSEIYGPCKVSSNVHNLCHVVDDVERFGCLDTISAYDFENRLHHIKLNIKQCNKPLQQIARRLTEQTNTQTPLKNLDKADFEPIYDKKKFIAGDSNPKYNVISMESFILSNIRNGDKYFLSNRTHVLSLF